MAEITAIRLTFEEAMLFALGRCAHRDAGVPWTCHLEVLDRDSETPSRQSRFCAGHQGESGG